MHRCIDAHKAIYLGIRRTSFVYFKSQYLIPFLLSKWFVICTNLVCISVLLIIFLTSSLISCRSVFQFRVFYLHFITLTLFKFNNIMLKFIHEKNNENVCHHVITIPIFIVIPFFFSKNKLIQ